MLLTKVYIRFYKSFNDDFLRKNDDRAKPKPWEKIDNAFYPYIVVPIDKKITTIVGANESGKSHLLSAIEKAISGENIKRSDFCRYSPFFTVKQGELRYPDFGTEWCNLSRIEEEKLRKIAGIHENTSFDRFLVFRNNISKLTIYLPEKGDYRPYKIDNTEVEHLQNLLPRTIKIYSDVALPASVPIKKIVQVAQTDSHNILGKSNQDFELLDREKRGKIIDEINGIQSLNHTLEVMDKKFKSIKSLYNQAENDDEDIEKSYVLAYKLICKIAQVDVNALIDLSEAIKNGMQGYANGIIEEINRQLSINLNFPNYWVQDRNFCIKVMARDYDLVFTITDRTGTEYSFDERSSGLKYFLSYYIQYRSHEPHRYKSEILLMDEPDAYLSSQAQQDLLKIFDLFAYPELGSHLTNPIQVVYVTHSPFLIDKNYAERIRVLQKGNEDEGTRVVKEAASNRYEPLRSSLGIYVGETAFIGNCNLMVEGITDQILIAGTATYLRSRGVSNLETLDLNQITIVPAGSASEVPYLVYLACGRNIEQLAVIVLLDSDDSGNNAKRQLLGKIGQHRRPLLRNSFILQIGDLRDEFSLVSEYVTQGLEIEDLIPLPICIQATKFYLQEIYNVDETETNFLTEELVLSKLNGKTIFDAIEESLNEFPEKSFTFNKKIGFARNIIRTVNEWSEREEILEEKQFKALENFENNFKVLFTKLNSMQRHAQQKLTKEKLTQKIERLKKNFISLHPISAKREDAVILLDDIEYTLDDNLQNESPKEIEAVRSAIQNLCRDYKLDTDRNKIIDDYLGFQKGLERIKYAGLYATQENRKDEDLVEEMAEVYEKSLDDKTSVNLEEQEVEITNEPVKPVKPIRKSNSDQQ